MGRHSMGRDAAVTRSGTPRSGRRRGLTLVATTAALTALAVPTTALAATHIRASHAMSGRAVAASTITSASPTAHPASTPKVSSSSTSTSKLGSTAKTAATATATASPATTTSTAESATVPTSARVGAIFPPGSTSHDCTGSVIASTSGDLVLTAAHCITGTGAGTTFVPGYNGTAPYGTWTVVSAQAATGWVTSQAPNDDLVVLTVAPRTVNGQTRTLQSVVGASQIGTTATTGTTVTAYGYPAGTSTTPVSCTTTTTLTPSTIGNVPTLDCDGFVAGTSGGPWLQETGSTTTLVGIVGGLNQGGCSTDVSYTPTLSTTLASLVVTADSSAAGTTLPAATTSGC